jgi:tetratricopeptide (TPR) repeat protein
MRLAQDLGRPVRIIRNYSTQPLRELFDIEEARRRSEESLEGPDEAAGFAMPRANARTDLIQAAILAGDIATAEKFWRIQWDESSNTKAWTRWLISCRLAAARAEMELVASRAENAVDWARRTIELCVPVRRFKYEIAGRTILGKALLESGKRADAVAELRLAVEHADRLGAPPLRWQAHAALGRALYATGDDRVAEQAFEQASTIIHEVAAVLTSKRAARFLAVEQIRAVLGGVTNARQ